MVSDSGDDGPPWPSATGWLTGPWPVAVAHGTWKLIWPGRTASSAAATSLTMIWTPAICPGKGIASRRIIAYLREKGYESSLRKLRHETQARHYQHSLWQHHSNVMLLTGEALFMQRLGYLHQNPVRLGLVEKAADYRWSSARLWAGCAGENEPLSVDMQSIRWRRA